MGYSHYFSRPLSIEPVKFNAISRDIQAVNSYIGHDMGIVLANGMGEAGTEPVYTKNEIIFNGSDAQPVGYWTSSESGLQWPSEDAGLLDNYDPYAGDWFAGVQVSRRVCRVGGGSYETFAILRDLPSNYMEYLDEKGLYSNSCKTNFHPYDLAVCCALIIARHHDSSFKIETDGSEQNWLDARMICFNLLGYGLDLDLFGPSTYVKPKQTAAEKPKNVYISLSDTAKEMRKELKRVWPSVKFSVRSKSYSGGCSIRVEYTDGPTTKQVDEVIQKYQAGDFDGMTDSYSYGEGITSLNESGELVTIQYAAKYVFSQRDYSSKYASYCCHSIDLTQGEPDLKEQILALRNRMSGYQCDFMISESHGNYMIETSRYFDDYFINTLTVSLCAQGYAVEFGEDGGKYFMAVYAPVLA